MPVRTSSTTVGSKSTNTSTPLKRKAGNSTPLNPRAKRKAASQKFEKPEVPQERDKPDSLEARPRKRTRTARLSVFQKTQPFKNTCPSRVSFLRSSDRARHVLAGARLAEERVERIVATADRLVRRHLTVRLDPVLEAEELPARVANLETGLADLLALLQK